MTDKPYSVSLWDTHPDRGEDTCATGEDFATLAEARACVANLDAHFSPSYYRATPYVELDGPDVYEVIVRPDALARQKREDREDRDAWRREHAMQQGMGLGVDAYNEAMGWEEG